MMILTFADSSKLKYEKDNFNFALFELLFYALYPSPHP